MRDFLNRWKGVFRFSQEDVDTLRLKSRAYVRDMGATLLVFEQRAGDLPVYHGEVMVNVNRAGQVIDVGSESFPQLEVDHNFTLTAAQALQAAAGALGITNFTPQPQGQAQVLRSSGDAPPAYASGERFSGGGMNTSLTITMEKKQLAPGASVNVQFLLGVEAGGSFRFFVNVEALP